MLKTSAATRHFLHKLTFAESILDAIKVLRDSEWKFFASGSESEVFRKRGYDFVIKICYDCHMRDVGENQASILQKTEKKLTFETFCIQTNFGHIIIQEMASKTFTYSSMSDRVAKDFDRLSSECYKNNMTDIIAKNVGKNKFGRLLALDWSLSRNFLAQ